MEYVIKGREPEALFRYFEEISAIPRPSHHEEKIADYLVDFARARGLFVLRDEHNNVLIKAPASAGMEDRAPLLLQGHTDMVCEKNGDVEHDFLADPIRLWVDGNLLRACGTTLGADNGIAVAMMLALLDGAAPKHPAYECLFTTAEETGLCGALGFDYSNITARRMLNLDSEDLGVVTAGCSGGLRSDLTMPYTAEPLSGEVLSVSMTGLAGGHSGANIDSGRANANRLMGRLLAAVLPVTDARLVALEGGSKDNAIPRECRMLLAVPDGDAAADRLTETATLIARELGADDRGFRLTVETVDEGVEMLSRRDTQNACAILTCPSNGVIEMSRDIAGLVEYSRNLGVVYTEEGALHFVFSTRSGFESRLDASINEFDALAAVTGCSTRHYSRYPGWEYAQESAIRDAYLDAYRRVTGENATVNVIHAGLECGIIYSKLPDMDMISIGPSMHDIHSPAEALDLDSTEAFWKTVVALIESL